MSTATEIARLQSARNTIRTKLVDLGLATPTSKIDTLATAVTTIENRGAVNAQVREGETFTIPKGYHNGSGVVAGVSGGGNYSLQEKTITPTKTQQNVTADSGYYGLSGVTVAPIPDNYNDTSSVTATAQDVLANKIIVAASGETVAGSMPNNGAVSKTLDTSAVSYSIPAGYHNGNGSVKITLEPKEITPTKAEQVITPTQGKVLSKVTIAPIPDEFVSTEDATAIASEILTGKTAYALKEKIEGTMPNNGNVSKTLTTDFTSYEIPMGYHAGEGIVSISLESKTVTPNKTEQNIVPSAGKVLSGVTVAAIPSAFQDVTGVTAQASEVLYGKFIVTATGDRVEGTMPNNGQTGEDIDGLTVTSYTIPEGYTTGGTVNLTSAIEDALKEI